ncbi:zf-HC2 domain-containing protein [Lachnospiraceae bacterium JLR.KK008]
MDCKETRKNIYKFIVDELEGKELEKFMKHVTECEECREELSIQYLVTEGMQHLEKESTFDLQSQLEKKMESAARKIRSRKRVIWFMYFMETLAILAVVFMTVLVISK